MFEIVKTETKNCKNCDIILCDENVARATKTKIRLQCKPCRSKAVTTYQKVNFEQRAKYNKQYHERTKQLTEHPCETCKKLCIKKYARAFCSDMCRFLSFVNKDIGGCWLWLGAKNRRGYGKICYKNKNTFVASRLAFILFKGEIPENKLVCHSCDNPPCVNPQHLWIGSVKENAQDSIKKGRQHWQVSRSPI